MVDVYKVHCRYIENLGDTYGKMPASQQLIVIADNSEHALALVRDHMKVLSEHYESVDIFELKLIHTNAILGIEPYLISREREANRGLLLSDRCKRDHKSCWRMGAAGWDLRTGQHYDCECECHPENATEET